MPTFCSDISPLRSTMALLTSSSFHYQTLIKAQTLTAAIDNFIIDIALPVGSLQCRQLPATACTIMLCSAGKWTLLGYMCSPCHLGNSVNISSNPSCANVVHALKILFKAVHIKINKNPSCEILVGLFTLLQKEQTCIYYLVFIHSDKGLSLGMSPIHTSFYLYFTLPTQHYNSFFGKHFFYWNKDCYHEMDFGLPLNDAELILPSDSIQTILLTLYTY